MKKETRALYHRLVNARYGTYRGFIRLWLAWLETYLGRLKRYSDVDLERVERLVFVCLGNVCRSPYAELIALEKGLPCASFGLSTTTGATAFCDAIKTAEALNRDLSKHRATHQGDFEIRDTDLLLVMEVRHALALKQDLGTSGAQIALLGFWSKPRRPHIHDPMNLSMDYFRNCYLTIESAVRNLGREYRTRTGL